MVRTLALMAAIVGLCGFPGRAATYYVDASRPNDTGDGRSWGSAKQTIQAAVDLASAGDTVLVTNGVYNVGTRATPGYALKNRVVITNAVTVRSVNGAAETVIEGAGASAYATVNAIRCVYMSNGLLDGFTLLNGATYTHVSYDNAFEKGGGGVGMYGCASGTQVRNCIIRACSGYGGGGADEGKLVNCLLSGNTAQYGGGACRSTLINCTLVDNAAQVECGGAYSCFVTNSIMYGNGNNYAGGAIGYSCTAPLASGAGNVAANPLFVDSASRNYRLQAGSPCINAGNNAGVTVSQDFAGNPRIAAGTVDLGAYETVPAAPALLYVDASRPNDAGDGRSWGSAKQTIQAAVDLASAGDTVLVTNGVYNVGTRATPGHTLKNRLLLTNAVTVASVNGPDVTVIEGSGTAAYNTVNAVRCVYLLNGVLDGFTLRGGATYSHSVTYTTEFDKGGGGVNMQGCAVGTAARNCIIRGNTAYDGGGVLGACDYPYTVVGKTINCVMYGNTAMYGGNAYGADLESCTVADGSATAVCGGAYNCKAVNSIMYGSAKNYSGGNLSFCCTTPLPATGTNNMAANPLFVDSASRNYRLQAGSPCINAGNNAGVTVSQDFAGNPRIAAGTVDLGAYEAVPPAPALFYVDASRANDAGDGRSWGSAKQTIQAAVDLASAGDTVLVTNGVYNVGTRATPGYALKNRVVITNAVTVRSVNGAAATVIEGAGAGAYATVNAIRCVYMSNGLLDGFTLLNGATYTHVSYDNAFEKGGGGVGMYGCASGTQVRNCIIRACRGYGGGGADEGKLVNCLLSGNAAQYGGGACRSTLINCTLVDNAAQVECGGAYSCFVTNSIMYGNGNNYAGGAIGYSCTTPLASGAGNLAVNPLFVDSANRNYRLQAGSPCIDAGNNAAVTEALDLAGHPRIQSARVDMGAYESEVSITATAGPGGSITPAGSVPVAYAGGASFVIQPAPHYHIADVLVNGVSVGPVGAYAFSNVTSSQTISATFALDQCALTVVSAQGGLAQGTFALGYGSAVSLWVTNSPLVCGTTQYVCTGAAVAGNAFSQSCQTNVTLTLTNAATVVWLWATNGWLEAASAGHGAVTGSGWYAPGSSVQIAAQPEPGYLFAGWDDGVTDATRWVTVPAGGIAYSGTFSPMPRGVLRFTRASASVSESSAVLKLTVERVNGTYGGASVSYEAVGGTATEGSDYSLDVNVLQWGDGESGTKSLYVDILDDAGPEVNEAFSIRLSNAAGASIGTPNTVSVTVIDDEEQPARIARLAGDLDFGNVATNRTAARTLEVWNDGNQPLAVTNVVLPAGFSAAPALFTVPAGGMATLSVLFAPCETRAYAGNLNLCSDATGGTLACSVSGTGVMPSPAPAIRTITGLTAAIAVVVPEGAAALGVEDELAPGLTPASITDGGTWDAANRKVKWFFNEPGHVRSRVLQYAVSAAGCVVTGLVNFGAANMAVEGDTVFAGGTNPGLLHPADDNGDWRLMLSEVAASVSRWRDGTDDSTMPVVVRGIALYLQGEAYRYDAQVSAESKRWVPLTLPNAAPPVALALQAPAGLLTDAPAAVRSVTGTNVTIVVMPAQGAAAWGMEESVPAGLNVTWISNDGAWDAVRRRIKWSFFDGQGRTLSYNVTGSAGACVTVAGSVSFDGSDDAVSGSNVIAVPLPFQTWAERRGLTGLPETLFSAPHPGYGVANGFVYAFGSNLQPGDAILTLTWVDGKPVVETPAQDPSTAGFVDVFPVGTEALASGDWPLVLVPASDLSGASTRCKWVPLAWPGRAFFKVRALLK